MSKIFGYIAILALVLFSFGACSYNKIWSMGMVYNDADKYTAGSLTYNSSDINRVEVHWVSGSVDIKQGEGELHVSEANENLSEDEQMHWMISDGTLYIQFCKSGHFFNSFEKKELHLEIPRGVQIDVETTSADIFADELDVKKAGINTVSGKARFGNFSGEEIGFNATSGDINVDLIKCAALGVNTVSGNASFGSFSGEELGFNTTSGNLNADSLECASLGVNTVSGDAKIGGMKADRADFSSTSGNVILSLLKPAEIKVNTTSGKTHLSLNDAGAKIHLSGVSAKFVSKLEYTKNGDEYTIGSGETEVRVSSTSGDVYVE